VRLTLPGVVMVLAMGLLLGWRWGPASQQPVRGLRVVERFLAAERDGQVDSALALYCGCNVLPVADEVVPVFRTRVLRSSVGADTAKVVIEYLDLGQAHSLDRRSAGPRNFRFIAEVRREVATLSVVRDSIGRLRIACAFPPQHWSVQYFERFAKDLDDSSRTQWVRALHEARTLK